VFAQQGVGASAADSDVGARVVIRDPVMGNGAEVASDPEIVQEWPDGLRDVCGGHTGCAMTEGRGVKFSPAQPDGVRGG